MPIDFSKYGVATKNPTSSLGTGKTGIDFSKYGVTTKAKQAPTSEPVGGLAGFGASMAKGAYGAAKRAIPAVYKGVVSAGIGAGSTFAQDIATIPEIGAKVGQAYTKKVDQLTGGKIPFLKQASDIYGKTAEGIEKGKKAVLVKPFEKELSSFSGGAGKVAAETAELLLPNGKVAAVKDIAMGVKEGLGLEKALANYPKFAKATEYVASKAARALPEVVLGTGFGLVKGQKPEEALKTGASFGAFGAGIEGAGELFNKVRGGLNHNVAKAIGMTGKLTTSQAIEKIPKATRALKFIADHAPDIKVNSIEGVEKPFDPLKADFYETLQAFSKTKQSIYDRYTALAEKAGDDYVRIGPKDFNELFAKLDDTIKNRTSPFVNKAKEIKNDLARIFRDNRSKEMKMRYIRPTEFQSFLEDLNNDVKADPRTPSAKVAGEMSQAIRDIMDKNISGATGEGYQNLRNAYSDLKSIEPELVNQFKKAARGTKGLSSYVESYGDLDVILSAISHSPTEFTRGVLLKLMGKSMNYLRDPENNLRRAFELLQEQKPEAGPIGARFLGRETVDTPALKQKGRAFGETLKGVTK